MRIFTFISRGLRYMLHGIPNKFIEARITYSQPNERLKDRKIVITGGGKGLGAAMAEKFCAEGAQVLIAGRNETNLHNTAKRLGCKYLLLDMAQTGGFLTFLREAEQCLGGIDSLVNNAGISLHEQTFFDVTPETFDAQFNTNFRGAFFLTQEFLRLLIPQGKSGTVLFISSETGETADCRPYGFTKAAVNSMVKGLAYLFAPKGIRINAIAPGVTVSDMVGLKVGDNLYNGRYTCERVYLPGEVAETACFLLSDAAGCISGQIVTCNNASTVKVRWK